MEKQMKPKHHYKWTLKNANFTKDQGKVFSTFSCGGGSTMGYKLAGFDVIGANDIDPKMAKIYKANHNPKYYFLCPVSELLNQELPKEFYELDILDGSPPCSSFSMVGNRERDWGKKRKFKEGQAEQVLDRLFFDYIELAKKLQPKIVLAENVKGILLGNAKKYAIEILKCFDEAGYYIQYFVLNAKDMGVPQSRERVFFIGLRKDLAGPFLSQVDLFNKMPEISMNFSMPEIPYSGIEDQSDQSENIAKSIKKYWDICKPGNSLKTVHPKGSLFSETKVSLEKPLPTVVSECKLYHPNIPRKINDKEVVLASSFPTDFDFLGKNPFYTCGMSVPPVMMAHIAERLKKWL